MELKSLDKTDKGKSGIYLITNIVNNKVYIGQSIDLWTRINEGYLQKLPKNKSHNIHLQRAWNKYGEDNFKFEVLEYVDIDSLDEVETQWINKYKACNNKFGYNILQEAGSNRGHVPSEETRLKISKANKGENNYMYGRTHTKEVRSKLSEIKSIPIVQLDLDGVYIKEWKSITEASEYYKIERSPITSVLRKKNYTSCGFIWIYKDEYDEKGIDLINHFKKKIDIRVEIIQLTVEGEFIKEYESMSDARRETNARNITVVCQGKKNTAGGYVWMYKSDYIENGFDYVKYESMKSNGHKVKKIFQISTEGEIIKLWNNVNEVCGVLGTNRVNIQNACNKMTKSMNYYWVYENDYDEVEFNNYLATKLIPKGKQVIQLSMVEEYINEFSNIVIASNSTEVRPQYISKVCKGKLKSAGGFLWMYKEDYDEYIENNESELQLS